MSDIFCALKMIKLNITNYEFKSKTQRKKNDSFRIKSNIKVYAIKTNCKNI